MTLPRWGQMAPRLARSFPNWMRRRRRWMRSSTCQAGPPPELAGEVTCATCGGGERSIARVEPRLARQPFPVRPLALAHARWHLDAQDDIQIAPPAAALRQSLAANAQLLTVLRSGRNLDVDLTSQRRHRHLCAEHRFPRREVQIKMQIVAFDAEIRVFREANAKEQIACRSAAHSRFAASRQPEPLPFAHARRNFHLIVFDFRRFAAAAALRTSPVVDFAGPAATLAGHVAAKGNRAD